MHRKLGLAAGFALAIQLLGFASKVGATVLTFTYLGVPIQQRGTAIA